VTSEATEDRTVTELTGGHGRGPGASCPVLGCGEQIDPSRLMCRRHWYRVPKQLRDQVWATWRSGQGALSREHHDAVRLAMAAGQKRFRPVGISPAA